MQFYQTANFEHKTKLHNYKGKSAQYTSWNKHLLEELLSKQKIIKDIFIQCFHDLKAKAESTKNIFTMAKNFVIR